MIAPALFELERWEAELDRLKDLYRGAAPFPHAVLDDFLPGSTADQMGAEFPALGDGDWIQYQHVNENKFGNRDRSSFGPTLRAVVDDLNSRRFVGFLERLTGIRGLEADPSLEGGGLHQSRRGGFLNVHSDFTVHPHRRRWRRRVNVLYYLNDAWRDEWGGHLELWDASVTRIVQRVTPKHNRALIFNTDAPSFHGHPDPLACPPDRTRRSVALYYFTTEPRPVVRSTDYRPRPGDGAEALLIRADALALRAYDSVKRRLGLDDRAVSRVLAALWGRARKRRDDR